MGVIVYINGILEEYRPEDLVFTEEEILDIFEEFDEIKTVRLNSSINTWCVFGVNSINDDADLHSVATEILKEPIYSPVLFIHDSEIEPKWKVTDDILYNNYREFLLDLKNMINDVAENIVNNIVTSEEYENKIDFLPQLSTLGTTSDKRILFSYNPDDQSKDFYNNEEFYTFSKKVFEYITENKQEITPFTIYADKKAVIIIPNKKVKKFLNLMIEKFQHKEEYEICTQISRMITEWDNKVEKKNNKENDK